MAVKIMKEQENHDVKIYSLPDMFGMVIAGFNIQYSQ
jgi:hypothetical protein